MLFSNTRRKTLLPVFTRRRAKSSLCQVRLRSRFGTRPTSSLNPTRRIFTRLDHHGHCHASSLRQAPGQCAGYGFSPTPPFVGPRPSDRTHGLARRGIGRTTQLKRIYSREPPSSTDKHLSVHPALRALYKHAGWL